MNKKVNELNECMNLKKGGVWSMPPLWTCTLNSLDQLCYVVLYIGFLSVCHSHISDYSYTGDRLCDLKAVCKQLYEWAGKKHCSAWLSERGTNHKALAWQTCSFTHWSLALTNFRVESYFDHPMSIQWVSNEYPMSIYCHVIIGLLSATLTNNKPERLAIEVFHFLILVSFLLHFNFNNKTLWTIYKSYML